MFDVIYSEIEARLTGMAADLDAAATFGKLKTIAPFTGQYLQETRRANAFDEPAVFVEISNAVWEDYNALSQVGRATINIHIVMKSFAHEARGSRDQQKYLWLYSYPRLIHKGLQGLEGTYFTGLLRRSDATDIAPDGLYVHVISYETVVQELATGRKKKYIMTEPETVDLETEYKKSEDIPPPASQDTPFIWP